MDDAFLMGGLDGFGNLMADDERLAYWHRATKEPLRERRPLDEFEHDRRGAVGVLEAENHRDVRVTQGGQGPASRRKRDSRSGSPLDRADKTLMATSRPNRASCAR